MAREKCVIFNPVAARGRALHRLEELRRTLGERADFQPTERAGHAEELALEAARSGYSSVVAAGGDGTVHEVANGLLRAKCPETMLEVMALGSANDYDYSLSLPTLNSTSVDSIGGARLVDVGLVKEPQGRQRYFINSLGLGFSGMVAIESRRIKRLQGLALYGLAFLRALWSHFNYPTMSISFDGKLRAEPTLSLTVAIANREGSFVVAPQAQLDDGWFDYLQAGALWRWELLRYMPRLARGGQLPTDHPRIWMGQCKEVSLQTEAPLTVHLDGEFFCRAEDGIKSLEIGLLPGVLKVKRFSGVS